MVEVCINSISNWVKYVRKKKLKFKKLNEKNLPLAQGVSELQMVGCWGERSQEGTMCLLCSYIVSLVSACGSCS